MSKLIRYVFGIFITVLLSYKSYGQHRVFVPVQPYSPVQRPVQRYNQKPAIKSVKSNGSKKLQAVKEDFINQRLNLTQKEAKEFWPMYRRYSEELTAVRILKKINNSSATADGPQQVDRDLEYETKLVEIKKRYKDEFYKILPPEKVSVLYKSEREFNDEIVKQLTERSVRAGD
jgi:hypothetical protein